jgi:hypothetical protein
VWTHGRVLGPAAVWPRFAPLLISLRGPYVWG